MWYATSVFYDPARWPYKLERYVPGKVSERLGREFRRRQNVFLGPANVRQFGFWEWSEILLRRLKHQELADYCNERGNRAFCAQTIRLVQREPVDVLWGFNTSSLEVFQWAKNAAFAACWDQTIGHPAAQNQVMLDEQKRHPEFFIDSYRPFDQKAIDRQNAEVAEADLVVVGSDYCAKTLTDNGCPAEKIRVVHYGYDESLFPTEPPQHSVAAERPVQFLFAGEVGPRKGIAYLLQAFANLSSDKAQLTLVGRMAIPPATFKKYAGCVRHVPQVPRSEIARFFAEANCFVFPSLFEGSAIVLYEACGAGLGIIQTDRCGDGVRLGKNGCIIERITVPALTEVVKKAISDTALRQRWQEASWAIRKERTWTGYRRAVANLSLSLNGKSLSLLDASPAFYPIA